MISSVNVVPSGLFLLVFFLFLPILLVLVPMLIYKGCKDKGNGLFLFGAIVLSVIGLISFLVALSSL